MIMRTKNFRQTGDLEYCVQSTLDHACWTKFPFKADKEPYLHGKQRAQSVEDGLQKTLTQIKRIKILAEKTNNQELLDILNEKLEFGLESETY